ncbi:MAG: CPP1-like family protein [Treponema sp.]|nr:CPP1-like family protein [Treponema sp.]
MLGGKKIKVNGIAGGIGLVLSFIVGIISGGSLLIVLVRAFIFGVLFFVFMAVSQWLISTFLPELLNPDASSVANESPGSRVDISVEDETDTDKTDLFETPVSFERKDVAGKGDAFTDDGGALDQEYKKDYTQQKGVEVDPTGFVPSAPWSKDLAQEMVGTDPLFLTNDAMPGNIPEVASGKAQNNSSLQSTRENLDPKKMASAIQTILKQE